jgi:hypothetical protein
MKKPENNSPVLGCWTTDFVDVEASRESSSALPRVYRRMIILSPVFCNFPGQKRDESNSGLSPRRRAATGKRNRAERDGMVRDGWLTLRLEREADGVAEAEEAVDDGEPDEGDSAGDADGELRGARLASTRPPEGRHPSPTSSEARSSSTSACRLCVLRRTPMPAVSFCSVGLWPKQSPLPSGWWSGSQVVFHGGVDRSGRVGCAGTRINS